MSETTRFTAKAARALYEEPYTLDEILRHIKMVAPVGFQVTGYKSERLSDAVTEELIHLGYSVATWANNPEETIINWEHPTC